MRAELVDHMGSDITVVNAARVSFDKESVYQSQTNALGRDELILEMKDERLINYLAEHKHFTPFTHCVVTLRETVPIFVARQRFKHTVGFSYNEVSRRYVDDTPEFYTPGVWRGRPTKAKQGSAEGVEIEDKDLYISNHLQFYDYTDILNLCEQWYSNAISKGVAPEQARMVLPQSMFTSYYVTGSLFAFARAYCLRSDPHAQLEIQELAKQWDAILRPLFPHSWSALVEPQITLNPQGGAPTV